MWGSHRWRVLHRKEDEHRAYVTKMRPEWEAMKKEKKQTLNREELLYLAKETGSKIPADFDKVYPPGKK